MCSTGIAGAREHWQNPGVGLSRISSIPRWTALAALAASGCTKDATETNGADMPGGGNEPLVSGPLCAECGPYAGGESSDFEGDVHRCEEFRTQRRISVAEAMALGFDITALLDIVEREFSAPMRWVSESLSSLTPGLPARGFEAETTVSGTLRSAGTVIYQSLDPEVCDEDGNCEGESCADYAQTWFPATLELELDIETADGAVEATTLHGGMPFAADSLPEVALLEFAVDLSEVSGTLRLESNRSGPHLGRLEARLALWPDFVRGTLSPVIVPDEPGAMPSEGVADLPYQPSWQYQPITAAWPRDGCSIETLPINDETSEGRAALARLAVEYPAAQAFVNMASPMAATWDDVRERGRGGSGAQLGLEILGEPELRCVETDGSATFYTEVHVWTDDGRLDWTTQMSGAIFSRPEEPPGLFLSANQTFDADAAFWSSTLRGVDLLGAENAEVQFRSSFGLAQEDAYVDGSISAELVPASCSLDLRCADFSDTSDCPDCGTTADIDYLYWSFFR
jgi:hypothetical protein